MAVEEILEWICFNMQNSAVEKIMHPLAGCKPKMCFGVGRWASIICLRYVPAWHCTLFLSVCGSTPPGGGGCGDEKRADFLEVSPFFGEDIRFIEGWEMLLVDDEQCVAVCAEAIFFVDSHLVGMHHLFVATEGT